MRVHVAFTPSEAATADLGIVVDVVRATSSIAQALASGYRLVLSTTNGTRAILAAAERCDEVVLGSLLNLEAVARAAADAGQVAILCAGFKGAFAFDDAYCAGRIVAALGGEATDAARAAALVAQAFPRALDGLNARTYGPPGLEADIEWCARESVLDVVPRLARVADGAAEIVG